MDNSFQRGHLFRSYLCSYHISYEQKFALAVIHDIVNLLRLEFVLYRYDDGSVCDNGQKGYCPLTTISSAHGYLVTLLDIAVLEQDVKFFYLSCNIMILECSSLIIGERIQVPVLDDASLNI